MSTQICVSPRLDVTFTPNHWSNEQKTKEYIEKIILPYVSEKRKEHGKPNQTALVIFDEFKRPSMQANLIALCYRMNPILSKATPCSVHGKWYLYAISNDGRTFTSLGNFLMV